MRGWTWRYCLVAVLAGWATFTALLIYNSSVVVEESAAAQAATATTSSTIRVHITGAQQPLTVPSYSLLRTGNIWSYVSKERGIDAQFVPPLVPLSGDYGDWLEDARVHPVIKKDLEALLNAAKSANTPLLISSAYRSGASQTTLLQETTILNGSSYAEEYVAKPGHSEHQLGLAVDLTTFSEACKHSFSGCKLDDKTTAWLADHAHEYGFILRYPAGKEAITGIAHEPWHFRYVGKNLATLLHHSNLTFDEVYRQLEYKYTTSASKIQT